MAESDTWVWSQLHGSKYNSKHHCLICAKETECFFSCLHDGWVCIVCGWVDKDYPFNIPIPTPCPTCGSHDTDINDQGMHYCKFCGDTWD